MNARRLLLAVIAGGIVALLVYEASLARVHSEETVDVVVAARDLPARTVITVDAIRMVGMARNVVPAGAVQALDAARDRTLRDPVFAGEVISDRHLAVAGGTQLSASALVPNGKTYAFNLPVSLFLSAPPRLQVHDRIDIIGYPRGKPISEGGVIVSDLEVIDISTRTSENASETTFLTIGATAEDIVRVLAAREGLALAIALRPFVQR